MLRHTTELSIVNEVFYLFLRYMIDYHTYDAGDLVYIVEKPWKWTAEYNEFVDWYNKEKENE